MTRPKKTADKNEEDNQDAKDKGKGYADAEVKEQPPGKDKPPRDVRQKKYGGKKLAWDEEAEMDGDRNYANGGKSAPAVKEPPAVKKPKEKLPGKPAAPVKKATKK